MMKMEVIGKRFGRLVVLRRKGADRPLRYQVVCACDCGNEWGGYLYSLTAGDTKSCGCLNSELSTARNIGMQRHDDLTGLRFGRLTVVSRDGTSPGRSARWLCLCECGTEKAISSHSLRVMNQKSCGCLQREKAKALMTKHGRYRDSDYIRELGDKRRAMKLNAHVEVVSHAAVYERDMGLCHLCGLPVEKGDFHLDHRIPLIAGGEHSYANCFTSHATCNYRKGRKMPEECGHLWSRA